MRLCLNVRQLVCLGAYGIAFESLAIYSIVPFKAQLFILISMSVLNVWASNYLVRRVGMAIYDRRHS